MANRNCEDDDYMSDSVLAKCKNTRPGLLSKSLAAQFKKERKIEERNIQSRMRPKAVIEAEKREEGLNVALDPSNKGYAMLQRMGYKPGMGVGKKETGRSEPVKINLKLGRSGLGHQTEETRKRNLAMAHQKAAVAKRQKKMEQSQNKFQAKQSEKFFEKLATKDLYKSQRVCEQLDSQKGLNEPCEKFFWPPKLIPKKQDEELEGRSYDRDNYLEVDEKDSSSDEDEEEKEEEEEEDLLSPAEKLEILTMYLRNRHRYCVWCGTTFADKEDMERNCPGNTADAHDD